MAILIGSMDFRPIFLNGDYKGLLFFFKKGFIMEQYIIPTAKEMAAKSDELGICHLKPALDYIGGFIERMDMK